MEGVAMKKISGLFFAGLLPLCATSLGLAEESDNQSLIENFVDTAFWRDSTELIQSQIYLLETIEQSLYSPKPNMGIVNLTADIKIKPLLLFRNSCV